MTIQIYYPHFLQFPGASADVVRFDNLDFDPNYQMISRMGGADPFPCFVGTSSSDPTISFTTPSIADVLAQTTDHNVIGDLSAGDVVMFYRKGKPKAFREAITTVAHASVKLEKSALLSWDSISATEDQDATVSAMLRVARTGTTDPWLNDGRVVTVQSKCEALYALGPVIYNGRIMESVFQIDWQNNLVPYTRKSSTSPKDPDWQSFVSMSPVITCTTNDLEEAMTNITPNPPDQVGGTDMQQLSIFLRKRARIGSYVPDGTAEHIELRAYGGWRGGTRITGNAPAEVTIEFHLSALVVASLVQGTDNLFDTFLTAKIPQLVTTPAMVDPGSFSVNTGAPFFFAWDLGGAGVPETTGTPSITGWRVTTGALPTGLTLNSESGVISGVLPSSPATDNATIRGENATGFADVALQWNIT